MTAYKDQLQAGAQAAMLRMILGLSSEVWKLKGRVQMLEQSTPEVGSPRDRLEAWMQSLG